MQLPVTLPLPFRVSIFLLCDSPRAGTSGSSVRVLPSCAFTQEPRTNPASRHSKPNPPTGTAVTGSGGNWEPTGQR